MRDTLQRDLLGRVARVLLASCMSLAISACASGSMPRAQMASGSMPRAQMDWTAGDVVEYRLVEKRDFAARTSSSALGNITHGAEICTSILPRDDYAFSGGFRAVMKPECSFWNDAIGTLGFAGRVTAFATGLPMMVPVKQPDWYILQHEQVHFAIMHVAALELSEQLGRIAPSQRLPSLVARNYELAFGRAQDRHDAFDADTSGRYDPAQLEKWVRLLEREMAELCAVDDSCVVRTASR